LHVSVEWRHVSQVHYVQKKTFVGNLWRFAKLYIFGKLITPGVQKIMFTFAQPPLTLVAMATKIWEFQHNSCIWGNIREITEHLAQNWGFTRFGNLMASLKFNPD